MPRTKRTAVRGSMKIRIAPQRAPNDITRYIGQQISAARRENHLSQAQLAREIRSRQSTVSDIEKGKNEIGVFMLTSIALVLRKPIDYFFPPLFIPNLRANALTDEEAEVLDQLKVLEHETGGTAFATKLLKFLGDYYRREYEKESRGANHG